MPLVRFEVRNQYALGHPELYKEADVDDPKAVLDGVAVAGLVGILRQLGDLAEFAAEVFHGLQEQLTTTASRSQKLKLRVQNIEAALPPIEKAILAQNSHIHFAYTAGSEWHPRIRSEQNHFIYNDLPRFIMDSYEECRDPPRFHILDKFDTGGPGSCLKRYSDPTFFRRASGGFKEHDAEKVQRDKKARKIKKKRSLRRKGSSLQNGSISSHSERSQFFQPTVNGRSSSSHTASNIDLPLKSEIGDRSNSIDSGNGSNHIECVFRPSSSAQPEEQKSNGFSSRSFQGDDSRDSGFSEEQSRVAHDSFLHCSSPKQIHHRSPGVTWVEKEEREEPGVADDSFLHCSSPKQIHHRSPGVTWVGKEEHEEPGVADDSFLHVSSPELIPISSSCRTWEEKAEGAQPEAHKGSLPRSSPERLPPGFSCVSWDEKEELSEAESQHYDGDEAPDVLTVDSVVDMQESGTNTEIHDPTDLRFENEHVPGPSFTAATLLEDVESETDNFMDALNSIDTESESELDYQTKHEVKEVECANRDNEGLAVTSGQTNHEVKQVECAIEERRTADRQDEVSAATSGHHPKHDSYSLPDFSSNHGMASDVLIPVPSVSPDEEQTHSSESSSTAFGSESDILASTTADAPDASKVESPVLNRSSVIVVNGVKEPLAGAVLKDSGKPQESSAAELSQVDGPSAIAVKKVEEPFADDIVLADPGKPQESSITEFSHLEPIKLWTNGGLLGLQPSRPPDFNVSNAGSQGSETNTAKVVNIPMPSNNDDNVSSAKDSIDPNYRSRFHPYDRGLNANNPVTPGNGLPLGSFIKFTTSGGASHESDGYPSQNMFGLGQRLLANGFGRRISLPPSSESELASSSPQPAELEKKSRQALVKFQPSQPDDLNIQFGHEPSDADYLTSSPPLEHMKLSFQPTAGVEASKLQLKFPDGNYCNESTTDMFPSFQLVPEATTGRNHAISDSDDDTFCRSSPYLSDDCLSHHSDTDARVYMLTHQKEFDVVDLDPYGSPSVFLDSAVQSVVDGGILMCTATDMAVLCGGNGEVCYSKYGSYPLRGKYCHEMALRILLASIESHANRYKRYIVPVLSVQMDFYVRVFVRIYSSAGAMKNTPLKLSYVYQCVGCDSFHLQPIGRTLAKNNSVRYLPGFGPVVPQECNHCGKKFNMGGPIWSAPIHDPEWVTSILDDVKSIKERYPAYERISAVLTTVSEELPDVPLFLSLHNLCGTLKCTSPSAVIFRSAVINAGYRISGTHVNPLGLKTDAPMDVIWDIMRCWVKNHPVKPQPADQSGTVILAKEPVLQANFARAMASMSKAQVKKVARFLPNPERHWGPKVKAGRTITSKHVSLLGPEAVNGYLNHENGGGGGDDEEKEAEEREAKRPKTEEEEEVKNDATLQTS